MTIIKAITYAESREEFFAKKLKQAERALDNVVKYGTDPDACAERGEIVSFYQDAIEALREKAEREKGCEYCNSLIAYRGFAYRENGEEIHYCKYCGKPLKGGE